MSVDAFRSGCYGHLLIHVTGPAASNSRRRLDLYMLAIYVGVAVIYTFPLVTRIASHFPGGAEDKDVFPFMWNNWWTYYALAHLHRIPWHTDHIFVPFGIDLRLHTFGLVNALLFAPLIPLFGQVAVLNLQIITTITLNGFATYRLLRYLTGKAAPGLISGLAIASTNAVNFHLMAGRPSCAAIWPLVFVLYCIFRLLDTPTVRRAVVLYVALLAWLAEDQQAVMFGAFWLAVIGVYALTKRLADLRNPRFVLAVASIVLLILPPAYLLYFRPFLATTGYGMPGADEALVYSVRPSSFVDPKGLWQVFGTVLVCGVFLGVILVRRSPEIWPWLFGVFLFLVLEMGPVMAGTRIPLLFSLVRRLPGLAQFRTPYRFQIPAAIGMSVLLGLALSAVSDRLGGARTKQFVGAIVLLLVADLVVHRAVGHFSTQTMPRPSIYRQIAQDPRLCTLLEVPFGVRTGSDSIGNAEELTYYQPIHKKRILTGYVTRAPVAAFEYYRRSPSLMLLANETPPPGDSLTDLIQRVRDLDIGYVVIHPDKFPPARLSTIVDLVSRVPDLTRMASDSDVIAFRSHAGSCSDLYSRNSSRP
jgi:hypothetical protein